MEGVIAAVVICIFLVGAFAVANVFARVDSQNRKESYIFSPEPVQDIPIVVLLTCTARVQTHIHHVTQSDASERIATYVRSAQQWEKQGAFPIVMVDNSNYPYPELQRSSVEVIAYDGTSPPRLRTETDKGLHEAYAIWYAYAHSSTLRRARFVVKVTGRYFVPQLADILQKNNVLTYDALGQHNPNKCMIVGCAAKHMAMVFGRHHVKLFPPFAGVETNYRVRLGRLPRVLRLPPLTISPTREGGNGRTITTL